MTDQHEDQPNRELSPELQAFEAQLASLNPSTGQLQRDRLMFEAGKVAARAEHATPRSPGDWSWPVLSTVMTAATAFLLALLVLRSGSFVAKEPGEKKVRAPQRTNGVLDPMEFPSVPEEVSDPESQDQDSSRTLLGSWFSDSSSVPEESSANYLRQRDMLLAYGGDDFSELTETRSVKDRRSNTRVSYMDLLDELTLESHGFASRDDRSDTLKPSSQGTDR